MITTLIFPMFQDKFQQIDLNFILVMIIFRVKNLFTN